MLIANKVSNLAAKSDLMWNTAKLQVRVSPCPINQSINTCLIHDSYLVFFSRVIIIIRKNTLLLKQ